MTEQTFEAELDAQRVVYEALKPFANEHRDRLLRQVQERFARERAPLRLPQLRAVEHVVFADPPDAA